MTTNRAATSTPQTCEHIQTYEHTATAGPLRRPALRRALFAAEASGLVTRWSEPVPGFFWIVSPHAALEISPAR